jgi:hypothetical protein
MKGICMDEEVHHYDIGCYENTSCQILVWNFIQGTRASNVGCNVTSTSMTNLGKCVSIIKMHWLEHGGRTCGD